MRTSRQLQGRGQAGTAAQHDPTAILPLPTSKVDGSGSAVIDLRPPVLPTTPSAGTASAAVDAGAVDGKLVSVVFNADVTAISITHGLGRVPTGFIVLSAVSTHASLKQCYCFQTAAATATAISIACDYTNAGSDTVTALILIF